MKTIHLPWNDSDLHADAELVARVLGAAAFSIGMGGKIWLAWGHPSNTSLSFSPTSEAWIWVVWTARMAEKSSLPDAPTP